ncbi:DUF1661 domain-containing protein [Porphyromonas gingivalis]|nr:DUF1661 domain-containing protein [Porphyromonas gingivalis]
MMENILNYIPMVHRLSDRVFSFFSAKIRGICCMSASSIYRHLGNTSQKICNCGLSFLKKWNRNFFVSARKFFASRATIKKFSRHVLGSVKRGNFGAWPVLKKL